MGAEPISAPAHRCSQCLGCRLYVRRIWLVMALCVLGYFHSSEWVCAFSFFFLLFWVYCPSPRVAKALERVWAGLSPEATKWPLCPPRESSLPGEGCEVDLTAWTFACFKKKPWSFRCVRTLSQNVLEEVLKAALQKAFLRLILAMWQNKGFA